jgi:hypothetical protein
MKTLILALLAVCAMSGCVMYATDAPADPYGYTQYCDENGNCTQVQYYTNPAGVVYYWYGGVWIGPGHPWYNRYYQYHWNHGWNHGWRGGYHGYGGHSGFHGGGHRR